MTLDAKDATVTPWAKPRDTLAGAPYRRLLSMEGNALGLMHIEWAIALTWFARSAICAERPNTPLIQGVSSRLARHSSPLIDRFSKFLEGLKQPIFKKLECVLMGID
jgi:hypothetical protein